MRLVEQRHAGRPKGVPAAANAAYQTCRTSASSVPQVPIYAPRCGNDRFVTQMYHSHLYLAFGAGWAGATGSNASIAGDRESRSRAIDAFER